MLLALLKEKPDVAFSASVCFQILVATCITRLTDVRELTLISRHLMVRSRSPVLVGFVLGGRCRFHTKNAVTLAQP
jgi:hypothetical protein